MLRAALPDTVRVATQQTQHAPLTHGTTERFSRDVIALCADTGAGIIGSLKTFHLGSCPDQQACVSPPLICWAGLGCMQV